MNNAASIGTSLLLAMLVAGCAPMELISTGSDRAGIPENPALLTSSVSHALTTQPADMSVPVVDGRFQGQLLQAGPVYFAASGRQCRKVRFTSDSAEQRFIACQQTDRWVLVKPVI